MKVVIAHVQFSLYWPARIRMLNEVLRAHGASLTVVEVTASRTPGERDPAGTEDIPWVRLFDASDPRTLPPAEISSRLWEAFEEIQPDVILAVAIAFPPGATAVRWCRTRRRSVVIMDDAREADVPRPAAVNFVKRRVYANVDAMLVPAASHLSSCQRFGLKADQVFYGVDVVDNQWFEQKVAEHQAASAPMVQGQPLPSRFFLGAGRQVKKKNWPLVLNAYAQYRREQQGGQPWDLVLVGEGPEAANIQSEISNLKLQGVQSFPFVSQEEMCGFYAAAGCLVIASVYGETWGLVVNEAMAAGLPVLVSNECGCAQTLVWEGKNGFTFSPHSVAGLAERMQQIASMPCDQRREMGSRSKQIIADWTLERFAQGAWSAIEKCSSVRRGFASPIDRIILSRWHGRYRPT